MVIGANAHSDNEISIAIGNNATATLSESVIIGDYASSNAYGATAVGSGAICNAIYGVAIGNGTRAYASGNFRGSISIGDRSNSINGSISIGTNCNAGYTSNTSICIGFNAETRYTNDIAIGFNARVPNGNNAIAIGTNSQSSQSSGIAIGNEAKSGGGTAVGYNSSACGTSDSFGTLAKVSQSYSTAIGYNSVCTNANSIQLGGSTLSSIKAKVGVSTTSDIRDKANVEPIDDGATDFLKAVQAIRYLYNGRLLYLPEEEDRTDEDKENLDKYGICAYDREAHERGDKKGSRVRVGVSAQAVQAALREIYGDDSYGNIVDDNLYDLDKGEIPEGIENQLTVNYANFVPFIIKSIQEIDARLTALENRVTQKED